jgi:hypothetical protein
MESTLSIRFITHPYQVELMWVLRCCVEFGDAENSHIVNGDVHQPNKHALM